MKDTCKILSYVFLAISLGFGNVKAGTESNWSNRLSLKLAVNYESGKIKSQKIPFTVTLINKTNERLHFDIPKHDKQLSIYVLTQRGKDSQSIDLLDKVGFRPHSSKKLVIEPKGELVFKRHFDLAPHKDEIANQLFVEFTARFELLRYDSNDMDLSILDSNKAKYEIAR